MLHQKDKTLIKYNSYKKTFHQVFLDSIIIFLNKSYFTFVLKFKFFHSFHFFLYLFIYSLSPSSCSHSFQVLKSSVNSLLLFDLLSMSQYVDIKQVFWHSSIIHYPYYYYYYYYYCHLPVSCRSLADQCGSFWSCKLEI